MRRINIIIFFFIQLVIIGCSDQLNDDDIVFSLSLTEVKAFSATFTVMHNATNRDSYYGFVVKGTVSDVQSEITAYLDRKKNTDELIDDVHYQRKSVFTIKGLFPESTFTFIVFGMKYDGTLYGKPASIEFKTEGSEMVAAENPNWTIQYLGYTVYNDNDYSLITVSVNEEVEERFFLATYPVDFASSFDRIENLVAYAAYEFVNEKEKDNDYWLEASEVRTGGTNFYRYLQEGDYVSYAIGLNADGTPTGHYVTTGTFHVDKYPACDGYKNLLNEWAIIDGEDKWYFATFSECVVNRSFYMTGWGNYDKYAIVVSFNRSDASFLIKSQIVADQVTFKFQDGSEYNGQLSLRGAYYSAESNLKYTTGNLTLAKGRIDDDGVYTLTSGFQVALNDGTITDETGMSFYLKTEKNGNIGLARMMFPLTMIKTDDL